MTQRNNSAHNRLHDNQSLQVWHRSLPAQSLCWLSSFSLLSGGLVFAQESPIDNIVPTVENSSSAASVNKVKFEQNHKASTPEADQPQLEYSQRRAKLKQKLNRGEISQTQNEGLKQHSQPSRESAQRITYPEAGVGGRLRVKLEASHHVPVIQKQQGQLTAPTAQGSSSEKVTQGKLSNNSHSSGSATADKPKDYNNSLIDPTNYSSIGTAHKYEAPSTVVITDRSSGCRTTLAQGQGVANSLCAKLPHQPLADSDTKPQEKHQPSWMRRSQIAHSVTVNSDQHISTSAANITRSARIASDGAVNITRSGRIASGGVTKSDYKPNRFIPNNFITPTTTVSSTPLAPAGGALPPPVTADNLAPRPSTVAYNIPLASTLPQIAYSGVVGRLASNVAGLMFPLSVPAPITSLFGWRIHPITGDRRFHSGTDLGAAIGTPVLAAYAGKVEMADWVGGYGLTVILNHNNAQQTLYGHMSQILVQPGQWIEQGTVVGLVGSTGNSTGPHLHFEVRQLTPDGWVATDPGSQLEYALSQLVQGLQTAQASRPTTRKLN